ncbi:MAG TPA: EAL domain-containing protein [Spongiibacteraceae bacterium]
MDHEESLELQLRTELRDLQRRQQRLIELSSDWYWELDPQHHFLLIAGPAVHEAFSDTSFIGKAFWEIRGFTALDASGWDNLKAHLDAHEPFFDLQASLTLTPTIRHYFSINGRPILNERGEYIGYCGLTKNITAATRDNQLMNLEHAVTRQLIDAADIETGFCQVLQIIGEADKWQCGAFFPADSASAFFKGPTHWQAADTTAAAIAEFTRTVNAMSSSSDSRIRQSDTPLWIADIAAVPASTGTSSAPALRTYIASPISVAGHVVGIFAFASREARPEDHQLLKTIGAVGSQVGQFLQRQQAEQTLRANEERFRSLTEFSSDWYWEQDDQWRFVDVAGKDLENNRGFVGKTHWDPSFQTHPIDMTWADHRARVMAHQSFRDFILKGEGRDGAAIYYSLSGRPFFDDSGAFKGYRGIGKDITAQRHSDERIRYLANHDALTTLPNRAMFSELLNLAISYARRYSRKFAIMFIDLDRFKLINDTLGHDAGDQLLQEIASRLTHTLRQSDVVARLGGDEFVVLVQEVDGPEQTAMIARKILSATMKPLQILGQECRVTASIGISLYPTDAQDELALMKNADMAMYQAKETGKNNFQFFSIRTQEQSLERMALEASLRRALERSEFQLHYQAKLGLRSDEITGVEALLRWQHPDLGSIAPAQFIPLAEETGLIVPIGRWVLKTACQQNMAWQSDGLPPVCMAINLSARQFSDDNLLSDIATALQESGLPGELLELELTESMVMQDHVRTIRTLTAIKQLGVRIAIDDFGVGYSSLAQIKHFPIDTLKVDRSFIRDLPENFEDSAITKAIIAMGKTLSLRVVAEGVETLEQENFLRDNACDETQGFYFSRPVTADKFAKLLHDHIASPHLKSN